MQLTELQWVQIASIIAAGIPIESVERNLGLSCYQIDKQCRRIKELESFVRIETLTGIIPFNEIPADWFTAAELSVIGVSIMGRGIKVVGRIALKCDPVLKLDQGTSEIHVASARKHALYRIAKEIAVRLWELRPEPASLMVKNGDQYIIERLMRKIAVLAFNLTPHWAEVELLSYRKEMLRLKETNLTVEEKQDERESLVKKIS
ncbi:MAG: hypothetical protein KQH59_06460 [Desulfobulbaceae bacterium]|nr:hypothetical protein [Desulfobulbaceae bacterium]